MPLPVAGGIIDDLLTIPNLSVPNTIDLAALLDGLASSVSQQLSDSLESVIGRLNRLLGNNRSLVLSLSNLSNKPTILKALDNVATAVKSLLSIVVNKLTAALATTSANVDEVANVVDQIAGCLVEPIESVNAHLESVDKIVQLKKLDGIIADVTGLINQLLAAMVDEVCGFHL